MLPEGLAAELDARRWSLPPVFRWLAERGRVAPAEMARTFNCGIGMVAIVAPGDEDRIAQILERQASVSPRSAASCRAATAPGTRIAGIGGGVARLKVGVLISGRGSNLRR